MNQNVAGISVPGHPGCGNGRCVPKAERCRKGIEIAGRMIRKIKEEGIAHGVHIMAIGKETAVPDILQAAGL